MIIQHRSTIGAKQKKTQTSKGGKRLIKPFQACRRKKIYGVLWFSFELCWKTEIVYSTEKAVTSSNSVKIWKNLGAYITRCLKCFVRNMQITVFFHWPDPNWAPCQAAKAEVSIKEKLKLHIDLFILNKKKKNHFAGRNQRLE